MSKSKKPQRITMKDIALATGYTVNTVSHALKDMRDISDDTKKVIRDKAREMGYLTNLVAVSMRSGKTKTLAIIIPDIANPYFATKVKEMDSLLRENGYSSIIINTDENSEFEFEAVRTAISRTVDGIIICPTQKRTDIFDLIIANSIPYVVLGRKFPGRLYYSVVWDDVRAGYLATEHLVGMGKKQILYLNGPPHISSSNDRLAGYKLCLEKHGIPFDPSLVIEADIVETLGCNCIYAILEKQVVFDAIFAFSDFIAFAALSTLELIGMHVPIVGVDDILSDLNLPVRMSSVGVRKDIEAHAIIRMLFEQMKSSSMSAPHIVVIETFLVDRDNWYLVQS